MIQYILGCYILSLISILKTFWSQVEFLTPAISRDPHLYPTSLSVLQTGSSLINFNLQWEVPWRRMFAEGFVRSAVQRTVHQLHLWPLAVPSLKAYTAKHMKRPGKKQTVRGGMGGGGCTVGLQEPCLHCAWWGVKLLIWEIKHEAFHSATGDVGTV